MHRNGSIARRGGAEVAGWSLDRKIRVRFPAYPQSTTITTTTTEMGLLTHIKARLVHTYLNYRVLRTSTAAIFLSNDHSLYAHIYIG